MRRAPPPAAASSSRDSTRSSDGVIERLPLSLPPHSRSPAPYPRPGTRPPPPPPGPPAVESSSSSSHSTAAAGSPSFLPLRAAPPPGNPRSSGATGTKPTGGAFPFSMNDAGTARTKQPSSSAAAAAGNGAVYQSMHTPIETKKKAPPPSDVQSSQRADDSSEDSYDNGSGYLSDKVGGAGAGAGAAGGAAGALAGLGADGVGWFHAKIQVDNAIQWSNNYKIQLTMFLMLVTGAAATVVYADNKAEVSVGVICGSVITIISCTSVMYTFLTRPAWRKHPNPIIFFRSLCDIGLVSVLLITELYKCGTAKCSAPLDSASCTAKCSVPLSSASCTATAGLTQFFLWSSESWFFVMAIDMLFSLQSPFTDYKRNVRRYHLFVWLTALLTAILLMSIPDFAGQSEFGYCWTNSKSKLRKEEVDPHKKNYLWKLNFQSWLLFYVWLILFWVYAITVIYWAYKRLNSGLSETLRMRLRVLHSVTIYVIAIIIYWAITFFIYVPYLIQVKKTPEITQMMNFMITCKGYFDFAVWFQMNNVHDSAVDKGDAKKKDIDVDVDLSPQVNLALRCEVLYYTTTGIIQAVRDVQHLPPGANQQELYLQPQGTEENRASLGVDEYMIRTRPKAALSKGTLFIDYCPHTFQTIREHFGVDTNQYIESLSRTTKERLSEGASGAFMFFSHDQQLIVKSMSDEESAFLRSIAPEYASFLLTNPDSLLTRFYGCHAIRLYGKTFNFVVMANLFSTDKIIHRRYDIKGSWVNRSAKHPSKGKSVTCRHCNAKFVFGSADAENCPAQVGRHEPNVVLKDNDLTARVRLDPKVAEELYDQLVKDAHFLSRLGIMDYSLLLGVHNVEYMVNPDLEEEVDPSTGFPPFSHKHGPPPPTTDLIHRNGGGRGRVSNPNAHGAQNKPPQRAGLPRLGTGTRRANTVVGPSVYYFGMIDILQQWTIDKKLERFAKTKLLGKDSDGLSALPPTAYCDRFKRKMGEILSVAVRDEYADLYTQSRRSDGGERRFM